MENDFLLIDEPTNHLDMHARECVKEYLCGKKGFILVSHDRDILDACIDHVLVLNRKTIEVQSRVTQYERRMEREIQEKEGLLQDIEQPVSLKLMPLSYHKERLISCRELSVRYEGAESDTLKNLTFELMHGERVFLHGENGCGKSTLLKIIVGALKPDAGTILWNGKAVDGTFLSEHVGYVPQENPLFEDLTVKDNLELWYANDKARLQKDLEDGWLFYFGMHKIYKKPVKKLSGGMKKRLSICCALAGDPDVLVMDEPGAALDLMAKNEILRLIKDFTRKGKSVIITSHEMSEITFCDSLYGIRDGCTVTLDKEINGFELTEWIQG